MGTTNFDSIAGTLTGSVAGSLHTFERFLAGAQTTGANKTRILVPFACTITDIRTRIVTAPVGATFISDVNKNGTTVFTTQGDRPIIADGANASSSAVPAVTAVAAGDELELDTDQIGSGTAGSDLMLAITVRRT